jgi:hypothetical protein
MRFRMLEDPSYDQIVRWGEGGDSFVVLEVRPRMISCGTHININLERKIHEEHPAETLQAQQLRQFRPTIEQI